MSVATATLSSSQDAEPPHCQKTRWLEDKGPSLGVGLGLGVGDAVDLQPVGVEQGDQSAAVAERDWRPKVDPDCVPRGQQSALQDQLPLLLIKDRPAGQIEILSAGIDQGDRLGFGCRADRLDQRGDDPDRVIRRLRPARSGAGDGVPGLVVGVPCLRLEGEEDRDPLVLGRIVEQQAAVLPDPVVAVELLAVP